MVFSERLKQLRNDRKLTQEQLAKILGKTRSTIAGYESENKQPDFDILNELAEYFNVSTDYLLGRTDIRNPYNTSNNNEDDWTDEELEDIEMFKEYIRIRREKKKK